MASMVKTGIVDVARARALFAEAVEELFRYPAIEPAALAQKIDDALGD